MSDAAPVLDRTTTYERATQEKHQTIVNIDEIFVYQSPVLVVGYSYGHFEARDLLKVGLVLTIVESLILILLVPLYWPLLGIQ